MALRQLGKERGQRLIRITDVKALVSMREFDQYGDWHFLKMIPAGMQAVIWPSKGSKLAAYWYGAKSQRTISVTAKGKRSR